MTKVKKLNPWKPKISCKPAKLCQVLAVKFASFSLYTKLFRVICRSCKCFDHLPPQQTFIVYCLVTSVKR